MDTRAWITIVFGILIQLTKINVKKAIVDPICLVTVAR